LGSQVHGSTFRVKDKEGIKKRPEVLVKSVYSNFETWS
jgi:hypothetical protein